MYRLEGLIFGAYPVQNKGNKHIIQSPQSNNSKHDNNIKSIIVGIVCWNSDCVVYLRVQKKVTYLSILPIFTKGRCKACSITTWAVKILLSSFGKHISFGLFLPTSFSLCSSSLLTIDKLSFSWSTLSLCSVDAISSSISPPNDVYIQVILSVTT